jgi:hypothetical protein
LTSKNQTFLFTNQKFKTMTIQEKTFEILDGCGLNWTMEKQPLQTDTGIKTDYFAIIRKDTKKVLGSCKDSYQIAQNAKLCETLLKIADNEGLTVTKAGPIDGGKRTFLQLKHPDKIQIGPDKVAKYLTAINFNTGSGGCSIGLGNEVASCTNQFYYFSKNNQYRFRHSQSLEKKLNQLPYLIQQGMKQERTLYETFEKFVNTKFDIDVFKQLMQNLTGFDITKNRDVQAADLSTQAMDKAQSIAACIHKEMTTKGANFWGLFNGITYYTNHEKGLGQKTGANARFETLISPTNTAYQINSKAFNFLKEKMQVA